MFDLKAIQSKHTSWPENADNAQIFPPGRCTSGGVYVPRIYMHAR